VEGNLGQKVPTRKVPPSLRKEVGKEAELGEGEESDSSSLASAPRGNLSPLVAALPLPSILYIHEDLCSFIIQVFEPPLVLLVLVLVGPSRLIRARLILLSS
jgi:hypothetical protein